MPPERLAGRFLCVGLALLTSLATAHAQTQTQPKREKPSNRVIRPVDPISFLGTETIKAEPGVQRVTPTRIDTRRFIPQIDTTIRVTPRPIRNPLLPDFLFEDPGLIAPAPGRDRDVSVGTVERAWPAINATGWNPPDPSLAVGKDHVVVVVNSSIAFFNRAGVSQFQQSFSTFLASLSPGSFLFDPKAYYDRHADRYVVTVLEFADGASPVSKAIVAVSDDGDPNGTWYKYRFEALTSINNANYWLDYPGFGYNKDAYAVTGNLFPVTTGGFGGVLYLLVDKTPMLSGGTATVRTIRDANGVTTQVAQVLDPAEPNLFAINRQNSTTLKIGTVTSPASASPTLTSSFLAVPSAVSPPADARSTPGKLDSLDARLYNVNYRNRRLYASHGVRHNTDNIKVRWYEVNLGTWPTAGTPSLLQSGEILPPDSSTDFHMPAIGTNLFGDTSVLFTRSANNIPADLVLSTRVIGDAAGTIGSPSLLLTSAGTGYGGTGTNRWGDYFDVNIDPLDDVTFWGVGMVGNPNGSWRTHVYSWTVTPPAVVSSVTTSTPEVYAFDTIPVTVNITANAPAAGVPVSISVSNSVVSNATVTIPGGQSSITVNLTTGAVQEPLPVTITAKATGSTGSTSVVLYPRVVSGTITLGDVAGPFTGISGVVKLRNPSNGQVIETRSVTLNASGEYRFFSNQAGTFDLAFEFPGFLRAIANRTVPAVGAISLSLALTNGDVNGDNAVTTTDFALVSRALGSSPGAENWDVRADLNRDGTVNAADIEIVKRNLRKRGAQ